MNALEPPMKPSFPEISDHTEIEWQFDTTDLDVVEKWFRGQSSYAPNIDNRCPLS